MPEILFVTSTLEVGGSETKIVKVANALAGSGHAVGIAYLNAPHTLRSRIAPAVTVEHLERRGKYSFRSLRALEAGVRRGVRLVVSVNFYPLLYMLPAVRAARDGSGFPRTAALVNTTDFGDGQRIWGRVYAPFLRRCDRLVYGCRQQQALWTRRYRLPAARSRCIYNGVDTGLFSPPADPAQARAFRARHGIPEDAFLAGAIGRFAPEKDFGLLVEALRRLDAGGCPAWLLLVGEGGERERLVAAVRAAGLLERTVLPGILPDVRAALAAMDVFVLPSRAVETFSNAALEAMAMARPVVLSDIGGAAEMIEDGVSGYLFPAGDASALAAALLPLCRSAALRERIGGAARRRVEEHFGFAGMVAEYAELIAELSASALVLPPHLERQQQP